jgi:hypothetical protein
VTQRLTITHQFVHYVPERLDEGVVYVSIEYATAVHRCMCGCGEEIVTPLTPTDWELSFDGESISLDPSIGNWNLPCRSHYWITKNRVRWAGRWSQYEIDRGRRLDRAAKTSHYGKSDTLEGAREPEAAAPKVPQPTWWRRLLGRRDA